MGSQRVRHDWATELNWTEGFPGGASGVELSCQCRRCKRCRFGPLVGKIPWNRAWKLTPVFLSGESLVPGSLAGYKQSQRQLKRLSSYAHTHNQGSTQKTFWVYDCRKCTKNKNQQISLGSSVRCSPNTDSPESGSCFKISSLGVVVVVGKRSAQKFVLSPMVVFITPYSMARLFISLS